MKFIKLTHKWVSLVIVLQLLIWLGTGLYFNLMDHHAAGGHTYRAHNHPEAASESQFVPVSQLAVDGPVKQIRIINLLQKPYYLVTSALPRYANWQGQHALFDAVTGKPFDIDKEVASALAHTSYNGPGEVTSIVKLSPPLDDLPKERNPVWQVNFNDDINTSVYIRQQSGQVVAHVDDHRRLRDLAFMLHFMDYANEGSFNNVQIILFALITVWLALTGFIWTLNLIKEGQLSLMPASKRNHIAIEVLDTSQQDELMVSSRASLFDSLWQKDWLLPSSCGGGGTCGECRIKSTSKISVSSADKQHFSEEQLQQGWRLACQHKASEFSDIIIPRLEQPLPRHQLQLVSERYISPLIKELTFQSVGEDLPAYQAGAHLRFEIPVADKETDKAYRHYSLANAAENNDLIFNVRYHPAPDANIPAGIGSDYLCNLKQGQTVSALGPIEGFALDPEHDGTVVLLGAGSGMAPLRAMLQTLLSAQPSQEVYFYYGARTEEDLLYFDELSQLQRQHSNFHYFPVLSQPSSDWAGEKGYVQELMQAKRNQIIEFDSAQFYLCGPQLMMQQTMAILETLGIGSDSIFYDSFGQPVVSEN